MKKILIGLGALLVLAMGAVAVFISTFDADRYRPLVVSRIEAALGKPVRLERLSLGWRGGLALELNQLAVASDASAQGEPLAQVEHASVVVQLLPLLRRDIRLAAVTLLRPRVTLERRADGGLSVAGMGVPVGSGPASPEPQARAAAGVASLAVTVLKVEGGELRVIDRTATPVRELTIRRLDLTLRNVSLTRPIEFHVHAGVLSDDQNVSLLGRLTLPLASRPGLLEGFRLEADIGRVKMTELVQAIPAVERLGLRKNPDGKLTVLIDRLELGPQGLARLSAQVRLIGGRLVLAGLPDAIEDVTIDALAVPGRVNLTQCSAKLAGGTVKLQGTADHLDTQPQLSMKAVIDQIALERLLQQSPRSDDPQLWGRFSMTFQGTAQGVAWSQLSQTLSGQGRVTLTDGKVRHLNVLREVFGRLSMLPGLVASLEARLPESYKARFSTQDTVLRPMDVAVTVTNGVMAFERLQVVTEDFALDGAGQVGLNGGMAIQAMLRVEPTLSAAIIRGVKELQSLTDAHGQLELPVVVQGTLPRVAVLPDVRSIASRLVVTKAEQVIGNLLQKALEKYSAPAAAAQ